jgi:Protein of unknown function with HXXEE motif
MSIAQVSTRDRWLGAGFLIAAILFQALWLGLPAVFLSVALVVSYALWISTSWRVAPRLRAAFVLGILVFVGHAVEEFTTGFQLGLPALFGRAAWSDLQYVVFNAVWALVFIAAALTLRAGRSFPVFIVIFFAVAGGVGNGVLHLLLVLQRGGYFPGAWTALLCLAVGIWLLRLLYAPTPLGEPPASRSS